MSKRKRGDDDNSEFLASLLDHEDKKNVLGLAIDAVFLLQEVCALKGVAATFLASLPRDRTYLPALRLVEEAQLQLSIMGKSITRALEAEAADTTLKELHDFVCRAAGLARSLVGNLEAEKTDGTQEDDETSALPAASLPRAVVKVGDSTSTIEEPTTAVERELPCGLLDELKSFGNIGGRMPSKGADEFVERLLSASLGTPEDCVMCMDMIVSLLEQCADVVRLLEDSLNMVNNLLGIVPSDEPPRERAAIQRPILMLKSSQKEPELHYDKQKVFFATDRAWQQASEEGMLAYSSKMEDTLEKGWTDISIPKKWEDGSVRQRGERGPDTKDTSKEAATHHIILLRGENGRFSADQDSEFYGLLGQDLASRKIEGSEQELLLFIHGYNNSFRDAIRTAGQLAFDLKKDAGGYGGAVLAYDWASLESWWRYGGLRGIDTDRGRAERTASRLADLLSDLASKLRGTKLHIVAHSMGNYVLKKAIDELYNRATLAAIRAMTRTVTFAAPDVNHDDFKTMVDLIVTEAGQQQPVATLLCSSGDWALMVSSLLRGWEVRAGLYRLLESFHSMHPVFKDTLDTIDASGFGKNDFGHGYFSNNKSLLDAISKIINLSVRAEERVNKPSSSISVHSGVCLTCSTWYKIRSLEDATASV